MPFLPLPDVGLKQWEMTRHWENMVRATPQNVVRADGIIEKLLLATRTTARKELILLHDERTVASGSTRPWLRVGRRVGYSHPDRFRIDHGFIPTITSSCPA